MNSKAKQLKRMAKEKSLGEFDCLYKEPGLAKIPQIGKIELYKTFLMFTEAFSSKQRRKMKHRDLMFVDARSRVTMSMYCKRSGEFSVQFVDNSECFERCESFRGERERERFFCVRDDFDVSFFRFVFCGVFVVFFCVCLFRSRSMSRSVSNTTTRRGSSSTDGERRWRRASFWDTFNDD
jgi:hypothetical protein